MSSLIAHYWWQLACSSRFTLCVSYAITIHVEELMEHKEIVQRELTYETLCVPDGSNMNTVLGEKELMLSGCST